MATILVVDDRPLDREQLVAILGYRKHRLLQAAGGEEALRVMQAERPDLVISDILLPTMDGFEFVRRVRADPLIAGTQVIFYTAHYLRREAQALVKASGVVQVISKPAEPEVILCAVDEVLGLAAPPTFAPGSTDFSREHLLLVNNKLTAKADELKSLNERLKALIELGQELDKERNVPRQLQNFCDGARRIVGAKYAAMGILAQNDEMKCFVTSGLDGETAARLEAPDKSVPAISALLKGRSTQNLHDKNADLQATGLPRNFPPVRSLLGAAIASPEKVYGWVCFHEKAGGGQFSAEDEKLASMLAAQFGRICENGELYAELARQVTALHEELTSPRQNEEDLRKSEARFKQIVQNIRESFLLGNIEAP